MKTIGKHNARRTAADLMTRNVISVPQRLPAAEVAQLLRSQSIGGVPVLDDEGHCVGIFCTSDFMRFVDQLSNSEVPPIPCPFQQRHRRGDGSEATLCNLSVGLCPLQRRESEDGRFTTVCSFPQEIVVEWQALQPSPSPRDPVMRWMTAVPITMKSTATIGECAARML